VYREYITQTTSVFPSSVGSDSIAQPAFPVAFSLLPALAPCLLDASLKQIKKEDRVIRRCKCLHAQIDVIPYRSCKKALIDFRSGRFESIARSSLRRPPRQSLMLCALRLCSQRLPCALRGAACRSSGCHGAPPRQSKELRDSAAKQCSCLAFRQYKPSIGNNKKV
jgi:hypothetical protein